MRDENSVGDNIRKYRKALRMSQSVLADLVGVGIVQISQWELNKRNPKKQNLEKIAGALKVSLADLDPQFSDRKKSSSEFWEYLHSIGYDVEKVDPDGFTDADGWVHYFIVPETHQYSLDVVQKNHMIYLSQSELIQLEKDIEEYTDFKIAKMLDEHKDDKLLEEVIEEDKF